MKKNGLWKYVSLTLVLTLICTTVLSALQNNKVYGKYIYTAPANYVVDSEVEGESAAKQMNVIVTDAGSNQMEELGTGAETIKTNIDGDEVNVPTCVGAKGTKTNPFVALEIVPDEAEQQLLYFNDFTETLGLEKAIKFSSKLLENVTDHAKTWAGDQPLTNIISEIDNAAESGSLGAWVSRASYSVFKFETDMEAELAELKKTNPDATMDDIEEKESIPIAEKHKYYTLTITSDDITEAGYDVTQFNNDYNNGNAKVADLAAKYPLLFEKDSSDEELPIYQVAIDDEKNWKKSGGQKTIKAERKTVTSGYMVVTPMGEGNFLFEPNSGYLATTKEGWMQDYYFKWVYSEDKPEGGNNLLDATSVDLNKITYNADDNYVGWYWEIPEGKSYEITIGKDVTTYEFEFQYWGLKFNDVLKRSLFKFDSRQDYEKFQMQIIAMTPAQLNKISRQGNLDDEEGKETLDLIERADMYYISSSLDYSGGGEFEGTNANDSTTALYNLYNTFVRGIEKDDWSPNWDYKYDVSEVQSFLNNDLDWSSCMKIIKRLSMYPSLPLMFNQSVGTMLNAGASLKSEDEVCMFMSNASTDSQCAHRIGAINNIAKLYLLCTQFDISATTPRNLMEHIYPYFQEIELSDEFMDEMVEGSANTTGYYNRTHESDPLCTTEEHKTDAYRERANYLWNTCTFYPRDMSNEINVSYNTMSDELIAELVTKGYLEKYLKTYQGLSPFSTGHEDENKMHDSGVQLGEDLNDRNVTIITGNGGTNLSALIYPTQDSNITSEYFQIIHEILYAGSTKVRDMTLSVMKQKKQYVKLTDTGVLIDYSSSAKYENAKDKILYLKVYIDAKNKKNTLPGMITSITLVNQEGDTRTISGIYKTNVFEDANIIQETSVEDYNGSLTGYAIEHTLNEYYVPYTLKDWQDGYNIMEFEMYGRSEVKFKGDMVNKHTDEPKIVDVTIDERVLFNLE